MNSINQQQPEHNRDDLSGPKAVEKIREIVKRAQNCFFCTTGPNIARPMNVRQVDDDGNFWFLSASDSHQNEEMARDPNVKLFFQGSPHSDFLAITGKATVSTDRAKIEELWTPIAKTWFTGGQDDPRVTVVKVTTAEGYYWDTKHGGLVAGIKMAVGAAIGKTLDDSIEGKLKV